jgi:peptidoglycan hydrolase CwlO-like protein
MRPLLFFLLLSLLLSSTSASTRYEEDELTGHVASTREEILSTRQLRKKQFGDMLAGHQAQLDAHNSGEQLLTEKDYNRVNQKVKSYTHKLKELDLDEDPRVREY